MNVLLIQPPNYYDGKSREVIFFPIGLGYIARATWWLLTAFAAFSIMYFIQKRITLKQAFNYLAFVIFLALPIIFVGLLPIEWVK